MKHYNFIVASYDIVRKDIEFFSKIKWNYCILDEGHVIKNGKTKVFKAIKQIVANHRLILSGTPIQVIFQCIDNKESDFKRCSCKKQKLSY